MVESRIIQQLLLMHKGEMILKYRKLNPWVPVEPWKAGDLGLPVCDNMEEVN